MNNLLHYLKSRWPLVTLVVTAPLVLSGVTLWLTDVEHSVGMTPANHEPVLSPTSAPVSKAALFDLNLESDRPRQIEQLHVQLGELRKATSPDALRIGGGLLQLGKLESAEGHDDLAADAFRQVGSTQSDADHWQVREAAARLSVLDELTTRNTEDRRTWIEAGQHYRKANELRANGQYLQAIDHANKALGARRRLWTPDNVESAESLLQLASFSVEHSDEYLRAEERVLEATEQIRNVLGPSHPANGDCLHVLATLADDRGEFDKADQHYEDALEIYRNSLGEVSREFARTLNRQGRMHNVWWKDFGAGKSLRALQIREQLLDRDHPDCAESLEDLGEVAYTLLNFVRAESLLEEAIAIRIRRQSPEHPDLARPRCLLAVCQTEQGNVSQAVVNVRRALTLSEHCRGGRHPIVAEQRITMAKIQERGLFDNAGSYLSCQRAMDVLSDLGQQGHPRYCRALLQQGDSFRCEGMFHLDDEWTDLNLAAARKHIEKAIVAYRSLPNGETIGYYGDALCSLCEVLYYQNYAGDSRETARKLTEELERTVTANGGAIHPSYALVALEQGRYCTSKGKYDLAIPFDLEFARRINQQVGTSSPWLYGDVLYALAGVYLHEGRDLTTSRRYSREGFEVFLSLFRRNAAGQSDSARLPILTDCYLLLSNHLSSAELQDDLPSAYDMVLALRGLTTSFQAAHQLAHDHSELQQLLKEVRASRQAQKVVAFSTDTAEPAEAWTSRLQMVSERSDVSDSELSIATRSFVPAHSEMTWQQLQAQLPPGTAFVDYLQYLNYSSPPNHQGHLQRTRRMLAFILQKTGPPQCVSLGPSSEIERAVSDWRKAIDDFQQGEPTEIESPVRELARLVWDPVVARLGEIDTVTIAPDGPLCFVSFAAMPGQHPGTFAIEDYQISYVNSGRWLYDQLRNSHDSSGTGLLLCGDIDYQHAGPKDIGIQPKSKTRAPLFPDPGEWQNLAATGVEIEQVADLFQKSHAEVPRTSTLARGDATSDALETTMLQKWRCIHFAGHGFFVDPAKAQALAGHFAETLGHGTYFIQKNQLLMSGLVLAPAKDTPASPSILTAKDVGSLDLRGTDLVVLSACETGLGCSAGSDGVLGLTRAFLTAGSNSVISSLWKVDDAATSLLMEEFYRNLWERGQSKREALRNAQINVLKTPGSVGDRTQYLALRGILPGKTKVLKRGPNYSGRSHPALWAAFVLNGDGG